MRRRLVEIVMELINRRKISADVLRQERIWNAGRRCFTRCDACFELRDGFVICTWHSLCLFT